MPFGYDWKCNCCGHSVRISGVWEFYRDEKGLRHFYGHPVPSYPEAVRSGIKGFTIDAYCSKCREIRSVVVMEFEEPVIGALDACLAGLDTKIKRKDYQVICDLCGTSLKGDLEASDICPVCEKGHFEVYSRYMS